MTERDIVVGKYGVVFPGGVDEAPFAVETAVCRNRTRIVLLFQFGHGHEKCLLFIGAGFLYLPYPAFCKLQEFIAITAPADFEAAAHNSINKNRLIAADRKPALTQEVL